MSPRPHAHPSEVLYAGSRPFPALAACEHYAGTEKLLAKSIRLQTELGAVFDITADCEDGAPAGAEISHAEMLATAIAGPNNRHSRIGARIHDSRHPAWRDELDTIIRIAGRRVAYVVLPKAECADDALAQITELDRLRERYGIEREIPVHVLVETHGALHECWRIAALPHVESIDFGLLDFISAHHGAIPGAAMGSPLQFEHPLLVRAKTEIVAAALGNGVVPTHNISTELRFMDAVHDDARRARDMFGFLRMWSIHPAQIQPIVDAMRPNMTEVTAAAGILLAAQEVDWAPIQRDGKLHDRASYRYYWDLLRRAHATRSPLPEQVRQRFFN